MDHHDTESIRNIALVGHSSSGKTTLLESLLQRTGTIGQAGSVERGDTVSDYDPLEREHGHSLDSTVCHLRYRDIHVNLIDTPGYPDFRGPTLAATSAVETAAIVINAQSGIELSTHRMMERAAEARLCRLIIINKIDAEELDLAALVAEIRETFGRHCLPINLPCNEASGVIDVFGKTEGSSDIASVAEAHTEIIDQVVEMDEDLMLRYLEQGSLDAEQLHDAFEKALRSGHLIPICFTSARSGAGLDALLELIRRLMPNPLEGNPPQFLKGDSDDAEPVPVDQDPEGHVIAHVFKIRHDPYLGKLSIMRVYQGTITQDTQLFIGDARKPFKVSHLYALQGKSTEEIDRAVPGDLCAVAKVDEIEHDVVLHDCHDEDQVYLKPINLPQAMFGLAIEAAARGDEQKIAAVLTRQAEEDPCFSIEHDSELNETVIRGLGELHLRIMLERLHSRHQLQIETRPPSIPYRETITRAAEGHYRHKKQTGGAGQFGEVWLRVKPLPRGAGFEFINSVVGGAIPTGLIPAVEKGVRQVLVSGAVGGFPLQDVSVEVHDGKYHSVDSKEIAFVTAGRKAFLDAIANAGPQILEPVVDLRVQVPDEHMGDITGNLAAKRARISGTESQSNGTVIISAQAPLSELTEFQTELKSATGGLGRYTMDLSHYEAVPASTQADLVGNFRHKDNDD